MFLKTIKHNSVTTRKVGRDMAAYTSWSDRVCQQLGALFVDSAAIDLPKITNKAGTNWVCGSWMYLPKTALQIFHSVSGNVKSKHLKPPFLCLSGISCEVMCTSQRAKVTNYSFNSSSCHQSLPKWHLYRFWLIVHTPASSFLYLPWAQSFHIIGSGFVSHKLKDDRKISPNIKRPVFQTKMMEQFRFFDLRLSCYFLWKHIILITLKDGMREKYNNHFSGTMRNVAIVEVSLIIQRWPNFGLRFWAIRSVELQPTSSFMMYFSQFSIV